MIDDGLPALSLLSCSFQHMFSIRLSTVETTRKDHEAQMYKLVADHEEERKLREQHKKAMNELIEKHKKEQLDKVKQQQDVLRQSLDEHFRVIKEQLNGRLTSLLISLVLTHSSSCISIPRRTNTSS
jgi:hypothetical protein